MLSSGLSELLHALISQASKRRRFCQLVLVLDTGHLTGCSGADPHNSLTSASSAS